MAYKYLIDSSAWVEYYLGSSKGLKIKQIIEEEAIATSIIALAELADKFEKEEKEIAPILGFIQSRAAIIHLSITIILDAAKIKKDIGRRNKKFGLADALHLATARQESLSFITADNDFKNVEKVWLI